MTCEPFCDSCGGNLGHPANGNWTCDKCRIEQLRKGRKERIRKDEFERGNPEHFRLQSRGGAWRYYRKVGEIVQQPSRMHRQGIPDRTTVVVIDPLSEIIASTGEAKFPDGGA